MAKKVFVWHMKDLSGMSDTIINKNFDCVIAITGNRGLGKSTLAYKLAMASELKFKPERDIVFGQQDTLKSIAHGRKKVIIADEVIQTAFNRDFYTTENKQFIKILTMNRDRNNLIILCIPHFSSIDNQIKNLVRIRIDVVRRGLAVIHTPNKTSYTRDVWDIATNEKIERSWLKSGIQKPKFSRLTTFRGILRFRPLTEKQETRYLKIKEEKRNIVLAEKEQSEKVLTIPERLVNMIVNKKIRNNEHLLDMCETLEINPNSIIGKARTHLRQRHIRKTPAQMFQDSIKKEEMKAFKENKGKVLLQEIKMSV